MRCATRCAIYYEGKLRRTGRPPPASIGTRRRRRNCASRSSTSLWGDEPDASIVDYGCGYGALADYLRARGHRGAYVGFDLSPQMIDAAREHTGGLAACHFTSDRSEVTAADYAMASGVFNVKQGADAERWEAFVGHTVADLAALGSRGFAFNALTSQSEPEKQRADLYYADPLAPVR